METPPAHEDYDARAAELVSLFKISCVAIGLPGQPHEALVTDHRTTREDTLQRIRAFLAAEMLRVATESRNAWLEHAAGVAEAALIGPGGGCSVAVAAIRALKTEPSGSTQEAP